MVTILPAVLKHNIKYMFSLYEEFSGFAENNVQIVGALCTEKLLVII